MQTFLPYPSFSKSAQVLDWRRLGKQRVECKQLLIAIERGDRKGWGRHPAALMWEGYERALCTYAIACVREWRRRGYNDSMLPFFIEARRSHEDTGLPWWLGIERFHSVHRANLIRKNPTYYSQFGWVEKPIDGYWWPSHHHARGVVWRLVRR